MRRRIHKGIPAPSQFERPLPVCEGTSVTHGPAPHTPQPVNQRLLALTLLAAATTGADTNIHATEWVCVDAATGWQCDGSGAQTPPEPPSDAAAIALPLPKSSPAKAPQTATTSAPSPSRESSAERSNEWGPADNAGRPWPKPVAPLNLEPLALDLNDANFGLRTLREPIKWGQCRTAFLPPLDPPPAPEGAGRRLEADAFELFQDLPGRPIVLTGNAVSLEPGRAFRAERIIQREAPDRMDAVGDVRLFDEQIALVASRGLYYGNTQQGSFEDANYYLRDGHGRGAAEHLELTGPLHQKMTDALFTTCASDAPFWSVEANHVRLDTEAGVGYADHAVLNLLDLPVFYTPYASFPIDDQRKSGLLVPTLMNSKTNGVGLNIPLYLNLAPNLDATLRARVMSERNAMGEAQVRYLSETVSQGFLETTYLPNDNKKPDPNIDADRHRILWRHGQSLGSGFSLRWDYEDVSDVHYMSDFGQSLETTTTNYLERTIGLTYNAKNWSIETKLRNYQIVNKTLTDASRPYDVYPQITFTGSWLEALAPLSLDLDAEFHHFVRDGRVSGSRVSLHTDLAYPLQRPWGYLTPRAELYGAYYDLYETGSAYDASPAVTLPVLSLQGGLYFDRRFGQGGDSEYIHTVEPLFHYVWAPHEDQSRIPIFDTGQYSTNFNNLLLTNRFSGADRINDANRLTLGLRNTLTRNGRTLAQLGVAEQLHFQERKTVLSGNAPETADASELATYLNLYPADKFELRSTWVWDWRLNSNLEEVYELRHYPNRDQILSLAYRYRRGSVMQTEGATRWRLLPGLHFVGQVDYNTRADELSDSLIGFEYESCCWLSRLILHDFKNGGPGESDFSIGLQFELKGFGYAGGDVEQELIQRIPYYLQDL